MKVKLGFSTIKPGEPALGENPAGFNTMAMNILASKVLVLIDLQMFSAVCLHRPSWSQQHLEINNDPQRLRGHRWLSVSCSQLF